MTENHQLIYGDLKYFKNLFVGFLRKYTIKEIYSFFYCRRKKINTSIPSIFRSSSQGCFFNRESKDGIYATDQKTKRNVEWLNFGFYG